MPPSLWDARIQRADALAKARPGAEPLLKFFRALTSFQKDLYHRAKSKATADIRTPDYATFLGDFQPLLLVVERFGPPELAAAAQKVRDRNEADREELLRKFWQKSGKVGHERPYDFFPRVILHPTVLHLAELWKAEVGLFDEGASTCPFCGRAPAVGFLKHPPGLTPLRYLICSLCSTEWEFARVCCPGCGEDRPDKLPRYHADGVPHLRAEACETCGMYLKSVDLTREPAAIPLVDELTAPELDDLAKLRGYTKLELNLVAL